MSGKVKKWKSQLFHYLVQVEGIPFQWGINDCTIFAFRCLQAMTGRKIGLDHVGKYTSLEEAVAMIHHYFPETKYWPVSYTIEYYIKHVLDKAGLARVESIEPGDLFLTDTCHGKGLAVCLGNRTAVLGKKGLRYVPTTLVNCHQAWRP